MKTFQDHLAESHQQQVAEARAADKITTREVVYIVVVCALLIFIVAVPFFGSGPL